MKTYSINWKHSRTEHGEDFWRSGLLGHVNGKPIKLAIMPRVTAPGYKLVAQGKDYSGPLVEDEDPTLVEDCFSLALEWYQGFRRSQAHVHP